MKNYFSVNFYVKIYIEERNERNERKYMIYRYTLCLWSDY